ncbi:single-stranded DNA-binding protein [Cryobacterium sp. AP23]
MTDTITLTGIVATTPRSLVTSTGLPITSFRLACRQRRFDRLSSSWVDADTNWYTVSSFRQLARNVEHSVQKGEPVLVTGRLRIRDWENQDRSGTSVEVEADAVGHNLAWGTTSLVRATAATAPEQKDAEHPTAQAGSVPTVSVPTVSGPTVSVPTGSEQTESETQSA